MDDLTSKDWTPCIKKDTLRMHGQTAAQGELLRRAGTSARSRVATQPGNGATQRNRRRYPDGAMAMAARPAPGGWVGGRVIRGAFDNRGARIPGVFCIKGDWMILLHGIEKKGQKTPKGALELARRRMKEVGK